MSKMLFKMNLISVVQQLPKEDIETIQGYVEMIEEENQELKLELSGYRQAILNNKEMLGLKEQNDKLKKQLEELERGKWVKDSRKQIENKLIEDIDNVETLSNILNYLDSLYLSIDNQLCKIKTHKNQQKEFINYLEDEIKQNETVVEVSKYGLPKNCSKLLIDFYKEILQKYKEIIGDDK